MTTNEKSPLIKMAEAHELMAESLRALVELGIQVPKSVAEAAIATEPEVKEKITFEQVRKVLSQKASEGFKTEIHNIISKRGVAKLSDIPEEEFEAVLREAGALHE